MRERFPALAKSHYISGLFRLLAVSGHGLGFQPTIHTVIWSERPYRYLLVACLLRRKTNGSFQECGNAAYVELDRRLWAELCERRSDQLPKDGLA